VKRYHSRPDRPFVTEPARHPPRRARSVKIQERRAGPDRPSVTDPSSITYERHHDPQAGSAIENAEAGSAIE